MRHSSWRQYYEVPSMSQERFQHVAKALFTIATQLSKYAYQNIAQARSITEREKAEDKLRRRTEELHAAYEELTVSEEELQSNLEEITKKEEERLGLAAMSKTDELTGLYNRRGFIQLSKQSISLALEMGKKGLIIYGDMDGLKRINDTHGHETGDRAIKAMASIIKKCFRNTDICARLGGDEFAITAINISTNIYEINVKKLQQECSSWSKSQAQSIELSISLGYVEFSNEQSDFDELLNIADQALYNEKRRKKNIIYEN